MTEKQPPILHTEHALASGPVISADAPLTNGHTTPVDGPIEDDSTIKCICGFNDDDGLTVLCEDCNTWQHIECYYPGSDVPEVHQCVNCNPRAIDAKAATERQKQTRFSSIAGERKQKRAPTKGHKKKNRDSVSTIHLNGNAHGDKLGHDRNSGSPLEIPPAKRPKTSHRTSSSTTSLQPQQQTQPNPPRRRTNSIAANRASPTKSPPRVNGYQRPNERFSLEFMQMYDKEYVQTTTNSYNNLGTTSALSRWLDDSEEFEKVANGQTQHDVYMRWDNAWHVLEEMSPGVELQRFEDVYVTAHGRHPVFHYLTAERDAGKGAFLGELTGQIAIKHDYESSSKMWPILRHPEPFVFFSDRLPICIDARKEGNKFRYIRRSCQPNSKMQIVIAGTEYRFCLVTEASILANDEITLPWYIDPRIMDILRASVDQKPISAEDHEYRVKWISGILAHFGRCACNRPDDQCLLSLARTPRFPAQDTNGQAPKTARKKAKKHPTQISPSSTGHATNSRAGSEAVNQFDPEAEVADSPVSTSVHSKPSSRDISPAVGGSEAGIGLGVDLSEREKRKIQEQERLFARLEQDGSRRRKRNSAGSTLTTPTVPATQHLSNQAEAISPSPTVSNPQSMANGRPHINPKPRNSPIMRLTTSKTAPSLGREYSESSTQTEANDDEGQVDALLLRQRRALGCSYAQRLLKRTRSMGSRARTSSGSPAGDKQSSSPGVKHNILTTDLESETIIKPANNQMLPPPLPARAVKEVSPLPLVQSADAVSEDVEMTDTQEMEPVPVPAVKQDLLPTRQSPVLTSTDQMVVDTPASPQPEAKVAHIGPLVTADATNSAAESDATDVAEDKPNLAVEISHHNTTSLRSSSPVTTSPVSIQAAEAADESATNGQPASTVATSNQPERSQIEKSPPLLKTVLSSSLASSNGVAAPSPTPRKKMSLSDWSSRNKKKKIEAAQQAAQIPAAGADDGALKSPDEDRKLDLNGEETVDQATVGQVDDRPLSSPLHGPNGVVGGTKLENEESHEPIKDIVSVQAQPENGSLAAAAASIAPAADGLVSSAT